MGSGYEARRGVADASGDVSRAHPAPSINHWLAPEEVRQRHVQAKLINS